MLNWDLLQQELKGTSMHGLSRKRRKRPQKLLISKDKDNTCLLTVDINPFESQFKEKHSAINELQGVPVRRKFCRPKHPYYIRNSDDEIMRHITIMSGPFTELTKWNQFNLFR